ncbi:MAG TPA: hypothetical protein PLS90_06570 [Candidatus Sumerlaeota bacterium]|nr:hypothetical protein [Candidatus Sumerlaeota bacterium]HPK02104.1 hypothetical protein [Candidatus Sumerlaeota bacterium]
MARQTRKAAQPAPEGPHFELRLKAPSRRDWRLEIWQLPSIATPRLREPEFVGALKGTPLELVEHRLLKRLSRARIDLGPISAGRERKWSIDEDLALHLGLLFRALAPMHNLGRIRQVADGIDEMSREEAGYWLGMTMQRKYPRRILAALRMVLTEP